MNQASNKLGRSRLAAVGALVVSATMAASAPAATLFPNTFADGTALDGNCTLREALISASQDGVQVDACIKGSGSDSIVLSSGTYELTAGAAGAAFDPALGDLVIDDPDGDVTVIFGTGKSVIDANLGYRLLSVLSPVVLASIELREGNASTGPGSLAGGALYAPEPDAVSLFSMTLAANVAGTEGGAISAAGDLGLTNSTLTGNQVLGPSGAGGGAVSAAGPLTISASTIVDNSVTTPDTTGVGGGFRATGTVALGGSIISGNIADGSSAACSAPGQASIGYNLIRPNLSGCGASATGDLIGGTAPGLGPLQDNGGAVRTRAIGPGSPALDSGAPSSDSKCLYVDQRGLSRPQGSACDIGAYEYAACGGVPVNRFGTVGADVIPGTAEVDSTLGFAGDDQISGAAGNDALCGGPGRDTLDGGPGADTLSGDAGIDTASYAEVGVPISVTLDGVGNDGAAGENDLVLVESVLGGSASDTLIGNSDANGLVGGAGDDTIAGAEGNDTLLGNSGNDIIGGGPGDDLLGGGSGEDFLNGEDGDDLVEGWAGNDVLSGEDGADEIYGGNDADKIFGGPGRDFLYGDSGADKLSGGAGNDVLRGGPGRDVIRCGGGRDKVIADKRDKVKRDCEKVKRKR